MKKFGRIMEGVAINIGAMLFGYIVLRLFCLLANPQYISIRSI